MRHTLTAPLALAILLLGGAAVPANAEEIFEPTSPTEAVAPAVEAPALAPMTTLEAVQEARRRLQAIVDERRAQRPDPYRVATDVTVDVLFAVWDKPTDQIIFASGKKSGMKLSIESEPKLPITVSYSGRLFSRYEMPASSGQMVVGVLYPVVTNVGTKKKPVYEATDVVYVPYDSAYYTPEIIGAGSDYLSFLIQDAYDDLRAAGIRSKAFPDRLLADVIDPYLVKTIAVIEQSDHQTLLGDKEPERAVGRFLLKLATNREAAFSNAISTAGAAGMVQFIPSTYKLMVTKRPDLKLIPDFRAGMADHRNAVKAQIAYLDEELAVLPASVRALYPTEKLKAGTFMAAAYNGGSSRVRKAISAYGFEAWDQAHANKRGILFASSLRRETVTYVKKLRTTYAMFEAGYFATPKAPSGALPNAVPDAVVATAESGPPGPTLAAANAICFADGGCAAMN